MREVSGATFLVPSLVCYPHRYRAQAALALGAMAEPACVRALHPPPSTAPGRPERSCCFRALFPPSDLLSIYLREGDAERRPLSTGLYGQVPFQLSHQRMHQLEAKAAAGA